jgi:CRISPR/Cas system-associated exonuclease Cas4 (RecB family)
MPLKVSGEKKIVILSYSAFSVWQQCTMKYKREKIDREKIVTEDLSFTIPGKIVHNASEHYLKNWDERVFLPSVIESAVRRHNENPQVDLAKSHKSLPEAIEFVQRCAENMQKFFLTRQLKGKEFISEGWFGDWDNPLMLSDNLATSGAADLIEKTVTGTGILYDYKATWSTKNLNRDQLIIYTIAAERKFGIPIGMAGFLLLPFGKTDYYSFTEHDKQDCINRMQAAADSILRGEFEEQPNPKCPYCQYYETCVKGKSFTPEVPKVPKGNFDGMTSFDL